MESSGNLIDPEDEVKKLQALVKKLETQNELLRSKQKTSVDGLSNGDVGKTVASQSNESYTTTSCSDHMCGHSPSDSLRHKAVEAGLEDVDVLDVDNLSLKDEDDSWLFSSPKPLTPQQSNVNVYKWVRQDFDHPSPEMESARRSLLSKLDEVARMNRSCSTPVLGSSLPPTKHVSALSRSTEDSLRYYNHCTEDSGSPKRGSIPHKRHSMLATAGSRVENGTFTRRKKSEEHHRPMAERREKGENGGPYNLSEGTDVEKLARQQEESLRQSITAYTSPKRVLQNKSMTIASDTDNSISPIGSSRSSPARYDHEGSFLIRHRNSFGSDCSTPPDSPGTFQQQATPFPDQTPTSRNLGNLSRLHHPPPSTHSSNSSLEQQSAGSMDDLHLAPETRPASRLPAPGLRCASPAGGGMIRPAVLGSNSHIASPQRSGLPTARRGIPRPAMSPAVRSSLPMPRRSGIPGLRASSGQGRNEGWRDGCF
ncbi:hypothetical protein ACOMHN_011332 [Nucella lapillus]